jgi:hypothetical protein
MPPFLSTSEEARAKIKVRYALSAYEDLNRAIRNLRRCFGFPYQEYIGYLNTMTRTHRARREHSILVESLRRWAMFGNVDAVLWIDYAKANQPPGSFKMGSRDSRPFSPLHTLICAACEEADEYEESEAWSDSEDPGTQFTPRVAGGHNEFFSATRLTLDNDRRASGAHLEWARLPVLALGRHSSLSHTRTLKPFEANLSLSAAQERDRATVKSFTSESCSPTVKLEAVRKRQEPRELLQEEVTQHMAECPPSRRVHSSVRTSRC